MSDKKDVSSKPPSQNENFSKDPQSQPPSQSHLSKTSSQRLDNYATQYLSKIQEEEIQELESDIFKNPRPSEQAHPSQTIQKNQVLPLSRNSEKELQRFQNSIKNPDVTVDQIDESEFEINFNSHLKGAPTSRHYMSLLKKTISAFSDDASIDLAEILAINNLLRQFAFDAKNNPALNDLIKGIEKKILKIDTKVFRWNLDNGKIDRMQELFEVTDLFKKQNQFMFIDSPVLLRVFKFQFFESFAQEPFFPSDGNTENYRQVALFQAQLISSFIKIYIQCPMSKQPHLDSNALISMDPFMRLDFRSQNRAFFAEFVEQPRRFKLFDYVKLLLRKFNLAEFPTWNNHYKPYNFVKIFQLMSIAFEYGLFDSEQSSEILKEISIVTEVISDQEIILEKFVHKNNRASASPGSQNAPLLENPDYSSIMPGRAGSRSSLLNELMESFDEESVRRSYLKQIAKIRLYCAKIIMHVISMHCDMSYARLVKNARLGVELSPKLLIFDKKILNQRLSIIVFKFLTKKFNSTSTVINNEAEFIISHVLGFFTNAEQDFFQSSLKMVHPDSFYHHERKQSEFEDVLIIRNELRKIFGLIAEGRNGCTAKDIEGLILDLCGLITRKFEENASKWTEFSLDLTRFNVHDVLFNFLNFYTGEKEIESPVPLVLMKTISLLLQRNCTAQNSLFSEKNQVCFKAIFALKPSWTISMLMDIFQKEFSLFGVSQRASERIFESFSQLLQEVQKITGDSPRTKEILIGMRFFNVFMIELKKFGEKADRDIKKFDFIYANLIVDYFTSSVLPVFHPVSGILGGVSGDLAGVFQRKPFMRDIEALMRQLTHKSNESLTYEMYFTFYRLFNEWTSVAFSDKISAAIQEILPSQIKTVGLHNDTHSILLRIEIVRMFERMNIFKDNKKIHCPDNFSLTSEFILKKSVPQNKDIVLSFLVNEGKWLSDLLKNDSFKSKPSFAENVKKYLLKAFLPAVYNYAALANKNVNNLTPREEISALFNVSGSLLNSLSGIVGLFQEYLFSDLDNLKIQTSKSIQSEKHKLASLEHIHFDKYEAKSEAKSLPPNLIIQQSSMGLVSATNSELEMAQDSIYEPLNHKLHILQKNFKEITTLVSPFYKANKKYRFLLNDNKPKKDKPIVFKKSILNLFDRRKDGPALTLSESDKIKVESNSINLKFLEVNFWFQQQKAHHINENSENDVRLLFNQGAKVVQLNNTIAEFIIDKLFNMTTDYSNENRFTSFFLNDVYTRYFVFLNQVSNWSKRFKISLNARLKSGSVETKFFHPTAAKQQVDVDILRKIWAIYLTCLNFLYFKPSHDLIFDQIYAQFKLMSDSLMGLSYQNPEFKSFFNSPKYGLIPSFGETTCKEGTTIFGELFLIICHLLSTNGIWSNRGKILLSSDRTDLLPLLLDLLSDCTEMITKDSKTYFKLYFQLNHEVWKGIIVRDVDDKDSLFYVLKHRVLFYLSSLIQHLDDQVVAQLDEIYHPEKLFKKMLYSVKDLFLHVSPIQTAKSLSHSTSLHHSLLEKQNAFKFRDFSPQGSEVITSPSTLLNLYEVNTNFSDHILIKFAIEVYSFLSKMASKAKFFAIFLKSKERLAQHAFNSVGLFNEDQGLTSIEDQAIFAFIIKITSSVEVMMDGFGSSSGKILTKVYFQLLPRCFFFTNSMNDNFYYKAPLTGNNAKMEYLCNQVDVLDHELEHNHYLNSHLGMFAQLLNGNAFLAYNYVLLGLSLVLNLIMLCYMQNYQQTSGQILYPEGGLTAVHVIATILASASFFFLVLWFLFRSRIEYLMFKTEFRLLTKRAPDFDETFKIVIYNCLFRNLRSSSYLMHLVFTLMGMFVDEVFYSLNFILLMNISGDVSYILHSLVDQFDKILGTLLLLMLVLYSYSYLLLTGFSNHFADGDTATCQNFYSCFLNTIILGFIPGGGISDKLDHFPDISNGETFWANFLLVVSFFLLVKLILINVIGSVIINTFNTLRAQYCLRMYEEENVCFICDDNKWNIQKASIDFADHISSSHGVRDYLFFVIYLKTLDNDERNETGDYVLECFEARNFSWIPHQVYLPEGKSFQVIKGELDMEGEKAKPGKKEPMKSRSMFLKDGSGKPVNKNSAGEVDSQEARRSQEETPEEEVSDKEDPQESYDESEGEEVGDIQH